MKKMMITYIVLLYLTLFSLIAMMIVGSVEQTTGSQTSPAMTATMGLWMGFGILSAIWGFVMFLLALIRKYDAHQCPFAITMITKLTLVPFFVVNFIFGVMLSIGLFLWFIAPYVLITEIFGVLLTYGTMIATSSYNLSYMYNSVKYGNRKWHDWALMFVLHFIFVADVVASVMLYADYKKAQAYQTTPPQQQDYIPPQQ